MARRRTQMHHIRYEPDWTVELTGQMHRLITTIQNTNPSPEQYARITNFLHSLVEEWQRMRRDLDTDDISPKARRPIVVEEVELDTRKLKRRKKKKNA